MSKAERIKKQHQDEEEIFLRRALNEFPFYLQYVFSCIGLPNITPLQKRIAEVLSENEERLILEAARGVGKSWIAATYATWRLLRNKEEKILIVSASSPKAIEIASFIRRLFSQVPLLNFLEPGKDNRDSVLGFDVQGCKVAISPSVAAKGIGGQLAGARASLIISDDVEIPNNSMTALMREKLILQVKEYEALLMPDIKSSILFLGTPQSMESIYNKIPYKTVIFPAQVPEDESIYDGKLDPWVMLQGKAGEPVDKVRFPLEELAKRRAGYGEAGYKLQYMLDTTLSDADKYPLKYKDLITVPMDILEAPYTFNYSSSEECKIKELSNFGFSGDYFVRPYRISEKYSQYDFKLLVIDPSGRGSDETTYAVLGILNGFVHLIDVGGTKEGYSDKAMIFLSNKAKEFKVNKILLESNFGDGMFTQLFSPVCAKIHPCDIEETTSKGQKEKRMIDSIEPLSSNHKLIINRNIIEKETQEILKDNKQLVYSFLFQFSHLTAEKGCLPHDDRIDAVAIGCQHVITMLGIDSDASLQRLKEEEMLKFLNEKIYGKYDSVNQNFIANF